MRMQEEARQAALQSNGSREDDAAIGPQIDLACRPPSEDTVSGANHRSDSFTGSECSKFVHPAKSVVAAYHRESCRL